MSGNVSLAELLLKDAYDVAVHEADGVDGIESSLSGGELVAEAFAQGGKSDLTAGIAALYDAVA
jgi:hypothetical protein